jgi:hypothetical protein
MTYIVRELLFKSKLSELFFWEAYQEAMHMPANAVFMLFRD